MNNLPPKNSRFTSSQDDEKKLGKIQLIVDFGRFLKQRFQLHVASGYDRNAESE